MDTGSILFVWLRNTDLQASLDGVSAEQDSFLLFIQGVDLFQINRLFVLSPPQTNYIDRQKTYSTIAVGVHHLKFLSPTCFEENYLAKAVRFFRETYSNLRLSINLSHRMPIMAAIWILLAKTKSRADLIEKSCGWSVQSFYILFLLSADFGLILRNVSDEVLACRLVCRLLPVALYSLSATHNLCRGNV